MTTFNQHFSARRNLRTRHLPPPSERAVQLRLLYGVDLKGKSLIPNRALLVVDPPCRALVIYVPPSPDRFPTVGNLKSDPA